MCNNDIHYQTLKSDSAAKSSIDTSMCIPFVVEPNPFKLTKDQGESIRRNIASMAIDVDNPFTEEPSIILCRPEYLDAAKKVLDATKKPNPKIECDKGWFSIPICHLKEARVVAEHSYDVNMSVKPKLMDLVKWAYINGIDYNVIPFN